MTTFPSSTLFPGPDVFAGVTSEIPNGYPSPGLFPGPTLFPAGTDTWTFTTPTQEVYVRLAPGTNLIGSYTCGLSVWRSAGTWGQGLAPSAELVASADRFYGGGRIHTLNVHERDDLIAGGYGAYIKEVS